jgi:D-threo-aldose 1-dehydrogenase
VIASRSLGRTGLRVSALGFGAAPLGDLFARLDDRAAVDAVNAAVDGGMTLIDTSPLYGHGLSEQRVGTALRRIDRERVVICTKVGRVLHPARGAWDREGYVGGLPFSATLDYSHDGALRSLEQSLLRLGTERVEIALIHDVDRRNHGEAFERRYAEAVRGAYRALERLRGEGVVRAIGIGVNEVEPCLRFAADCDIDCVLLAGRYTLLDTSALDDFLPLAQRRGIGVMLGGVFNSGVLATGAVTGAKFDYADASPAMLARTTRIESHCRVHQVPLAVAAVQFAAAHPAVSSVVLGAVTPDEVRRHLQGWHHRAVPALWAALKADGLLPEHAPTP